VGLAKTDKNEFVLWISLSGGWDLATGNAWTQTTQECGRIEKNGIILHSIEGESLFLRRERKR
jgi:hypothetical protein